MGPPPVPGQGTPQPAAQKSKDSDVGAKYSRLKRKYFELEEVSNRTRPRSPSQGSMSLVTLRIRPTSRDRPRTTPYDLASAHRNTRRLCCS